MVSRATGAASPPRLAVRVFAVFALLYLCTWAGHYTSGDGAYKIAWAKHLLGHDSGLAPDSQGNYSKYGIGHSLLAMPGLEAAYLIQKATGIRTEAALYTLIFVINGALFLALVAFYLAHFYSSAAVWRTVWIMGLATLWWPYTKLDFSEPLVLTIAFLGFVLMRFGTPLAGMLVAAFTLTIRADSVVLLIPLMIWYWLGHPSVRAAAKMALGLAPSVALVLFANYIRYHSLADRGYVNEGFTNPILVGLYGSLLSSGKSIFLFSPPLLLGIWGWKSFSRRGETRADAWLFLSILVAQILLYAKWWDWSSDDAWGIRFVIPGVMMMCIPMIAKIERLAAVIPLAAAGVAVQLLAVMAGGLSFPVLLHAEHAQRAALYVGGSNRVDFEDLRFDPGYSQILGNWILVRELLHVPPQPGQAAEALQTGTRLYDAIPPRDWAAAAHWDFVWAHGRTNPAAPVASSSRP